MDYIKCNSWSEVPNKFTGIVEYLVNRTKYWFKEGNYHREDGPAVEYQNGTTIWFKEGNYHREDGPAVEHINGTKEWYKNGQRHRIDGPAIENSNGSRSWYRDGYLHRLDGPAYENPDGTKIWSIKFTEYNEKFLNYLANNSIYLRKEKGEYDLEWLLFLTSKGIEKFPVMLGMESYESFIPLFNKILEVV
jgi:hypothetical protein